MSVPFNILAALNDRELCLRVPYNSPLAPLISFLSLIAIPALQRIWSSLHLRILAAEGLYGARRML